MAVTALADVKANFVDITTIPLGVSSGVVLTNGAAPLTGNWSAGNFAISSQNSTDWQNIVAWGADPTGVSDSSTAIANAIAATSANGGVVYAPAGTYILNATITLSKRVTIIGAGGMTNSGNYVTSFKKKSTLAGAAFVVAADACQFWNFHVNGNSGGGATGDGIVVAVAAGNARYFVAHNVDVVSCSGNGWNFGNGLTTNVDLFGIYDSTSQLNGGVGFILDSATPDANAGVFVNCHALTNTGDGYQFNRSQYNTIIGGTAQNNTGAGYHFKTGSIQNDVINGDPELNTGGNILVDAGASQTMIHGVPTARIVNNSTSTNIYSDIGRVQTSLIVGAQSSAGADATVNAFANVAQGSDTGHAFAAGLSTATTKRVNIGYAGTADVGYIQGINVGTGYRPLTLNPAGSTVIAGGVTASANGVLSWDIGTTPLAVPGVIFTQTADKVTTANTLTSLFGTGVGTLTFPANFFVAGRTIRVRMGGYVSAADGGAGTKTLTITLGGTTVATGTSNATVSTNLNTGWEVDAILTCRTTGAPGTFQGGGCWTSQSSATGGTITAHADSTATSSINTTGTLALDVQYNNGNAVGTSTTTYALVEALN